MSSLQPSIRPRRAGAARLYILSCVIAVAGLAVGCDSDSPTEPEGPTLADVQAQVFTPNCASSGCHAGTDAPEGLDLTAGSAYENIVDVPSNQVSDIMRVEPGEPAESYLFIKITGGDRMAPGTFQMPIGVELSEDQIDLVEDWILGGAGR